MRDCLGFCATEANCLLFLVRLFCRQEKEDQPLSVSNTPISNLCLPLFSICCTNKRFQTRTGVAPNILLFPYGQERGELGVSVVAYHVEKIELTPEEEELKVTIAQKERMEKDHDAIKQYYKVITVTTIDGQGLLRSWADDLAARPLEEKKSPEGREATKMCQQAADTLKGFFKLCTKRVFKTLNADFRKFPMIFVGIC